MSTCLALPGFGRLAVHTKWRQKYGGSLPLRESSRPGVGPLPPCVPRQLKKTTTKYCVALPDKDNSMVVVQLTV